MDVDGLTLQVLPVADSDAEELADLTGGSTPSCLAWTRPRSPGSPAEAAPEGAKGLDGTLADWLLVQFGTLDGLRAMLATVRGWASRTSRTMEVSIGGDALKMPAVTSQQQEKIIDAWLTRHALGG